MPAAVLLPGEEKDAHAEHSEPVTKTGGQRRPRPPETSRKRRLVVPPLLALFLPSVLMMSVCYYHVSHGWYQANNLLRGGGGREQVAAQQQTVLWRQLQEHHNAAVGYVSGEGRGPSKGDRDCESFGNGNAIPGVLPCHDERDEDAVIVAAPEVSDPNSTGFVPGGPEDLRPASPSRPLPPRNVVDLTVFVALDPGARSIAHSVAKLLTQTMNATMGNMEFFMDLLGTEQGNWDSNEGADNNLDKGKVDDEEDDFPPTEPVPLPDGSRPAGGSDVVASQPENSAMVGFEDHVQPKQEGMQGEQGTSGDTGNSPRRVDRFNMYYMKTQTELGRQRSDRWWWKYDIQYLCRWKDNEAPVLSDEKMDDIAANMTRSLDEERLSEVLRGMTDSSVVILKIYPETDSADPPDSSDGNLLLEPLDASEWSWTRYLGFAVFLGTVAGLILATLVGSLRRRRKTRQQVWGNLASEEGVRELLNTGWLLHDGHMEVFHKERAGYREDDSVLIGGYEQREPGPGTEIITPTMTTQEGSSTRGPSTTPDHSINTRSQQTDADSAQFHSQEGPITSSRQQRRAVSGYSGPSMQMFSVQVCFLMILQVLVPVNAFVHCRATTRTSASPLYKLAESIPFDNGSYDSRASVLRRGRENPGSLETTALKSSESVPPSRGLSKFHQSILSRTRTARQAFVTGRDPVTLSLRDSPTLKWLAGSAAKSSQGSRPSTSQLYVNGTVLEKSTASLDRYLWLQGEASVDDGWYDEQPEATEASHDYFTMEWIAEILLERPGYVNILPRECLVSSLDETHNRHEWSWNIQSSNDWQEEAANRLPPSTGDVLVCTGFSLARRKGLLATVDTEKGKIIRANDRTRSQLLWPNEVTPVPKDIVAAQPDGLSGGSYQDAVLISDGFLVPGKDRGGLYLVRQTGNPQKEWTVGLTAPSSSWFYHKATWIDLTADGRRSILTSRCRVTAKFPKSSNDFADQVTSGIAQEGELVWLEAPKPHSYDPRTGTPLEADGTIFDPFASRHLPWREHVLATGPDVMFSVADLDPSDDCVEVIASQFFDQSVRLYSITRGNNPHVTFQRSIDTQCGAAFACVLSDLDQDRVDLTTEDAGHVIVDAGSTVPSLKNGDRFSHLLVTSHECTYEKADEDVSVSSAHSGPATDRSQLEGGSVFAYRVPVGAPDAWKTAPWLRTTVATGFTVQGQLGNVINPGAPGFCYTFPARKGETDSRPLLAVAGDCAESAYIFRPVESEDPNDPDASTRYKLMVEIECESTVGSIGVGYGDFVEMDRDENEDYAKLYIPCFEKDKVLVFSLGAARTA